MKLDMHCHTKEGSIDAKVPIQEYITKLVKEGFDGMLVTDHNSYDGYRKFEKIAKNLHLEKPFTVLKGIEYDTRDGGHVIAVLPDCINDAFMEIRGMTLAQLEKIVHERGGILGLAHPYGRDFLHLPIRDLVKNTMNSWKNLISWKHLMPASDRGQMPVLIIWQAVCISRKWQGRMHIRCA